MSYDFTGAKSSLSRASNVDGWGGKKTGPLQSVGGGADKKSAQLECDYLIPLQQNTLRAEELSDEISAFILDIERKISAITNHYDE